MASTNSATGTTGPDPTTSGAAAQANSLGNVDLNETVSNTSELKDKAPELWNKILEGIAMNICNKMKRDNDEIKRLMAESDKGLTA